MELDPSRGGVEALSVQALAWVEAGSREMAQDCDAWRQQREGGRLN